MNKKIKSISFNLKTEADMLKHIGRKNFSRYVKGLIKKDMNTIKTKGGIKIDLTKDA